MDELSDAELEAYLVGYTDAQQRWAAYMAGVTTGVDAANTRACSDAWWDGFAEGLCARPAPYRRQGGRGLGRGRPCRSLTRPPAARPVAR